VTWNEADHPRNEDGEFAKRLSAQIGERLLSGSTWPDELSQQIKAEHPDVKLDLYRTRGGVNLSRIVVPERSKGVGTAIMRRIVEIADRNGDTVTLTPSADFGGNKARLVKFYKRFGFVENKGRNKDYEISETMYRPPS
jgi:GNAT superfamily N-acetyltransferase